MSQSNMFTKMYPSEELKRIEERKEENDKIEELFNRKRRDWEKRLTPVFKAIYQNNFSMNNSKKIVDAQAEVLVLRQECNEKIAKYSQRLSKGRSDNALLAQEKFVFYSVGFGMKTNLGEKRMLIEGNLRENDRYCNLIETHIEFLRSTLSTLESYQYSIKNVVYLMELLGK